VEPDLKLSDRLLSWVDNHRRWLFLAVFLIYAAGFNGRWRLEPDTALYATIGRYVAEGRGYTHPMGAQAPINPGLPLIFAVNFLIHGYETVWFACAVMWLMAMLGLGLVYRLFLMYCGRPTAVLLTLMVASAKYFCLYAFELLTDMPFFVGLWLFLNGYEGVQRKSCKLWVSFFLAVLGVLVMALFRSVVVIVFVAGGAAAVWKFLRGPDRTRFALLIITALVCLFAVRSLDPRLRSALEQVPDERLAMGYVSNLGKTLHRALTINVPMFFQDRAPTAFFGIQLAPGTNSLATIVVIGLGVGLMAYNLLWGLLVLAFVLQWLVFLPDVRYFLPIMPLLICGWWRGALWCERHLPARWSGRALAVMLSLALVPNLIRVGDLIILKQRRTPFLKFHEHGRYNGVPDLARSLRENTPTNALVLIEEDKIVQPLIFYSDRRVASTRRIPQNLLKESHLYVVGPVGDGFRKTLKSKRLTLGEELTTIPREDQPAWQLYPAVITPAPPVGAAKPPGS